MQSLAVLNFSSQLASRPDLADKPLLLNFYSNTIFLTGTRGERRVSLINRILVAYKQYNYILVSSLRIVLYLAI